jgi:hypothetical protein
MVGRILAVAGILSVAVLAGCRGGTERGPERYEVRGVVTFHGEPVPYGEIMLEPDSGQGNSGPAARGVIESGNYLISDSHGAVSGPLRVRITGYDGNAPAGGGTMPHGAPLFPEFVAAVEQPKHEATHDFSIGGK